MKRNRKETVGKPGNLGHQVLAAIGMVLCVILIPILVLNCTLLAKSFLNRDQVPGIRGIFPMIILTDSMKPEFSAGDLIICHTTDAEKIRKGDIICFYDPEGNGTTMVTHRVIKVTTDDKGELAWETKGDVNNTKDSSLVPAKNLVGIYQYHMPGIGRIAMFTQTPGGMIICVVCPLVVLVICDSIRRKKYEEIRKKDTNTLLEELETLRAERKQIATDMEATGGK